MRVFVAGAAGAMGKQLVPRLVKAGHQVIGMTRTESKRSALWELGAEPVVPDVAGLESLLAHDVVLTGDGGGKVPALARQLRGRNRVARALPGWARLGARIPGAAIRPVESTARRAHSCSTARPAGRGVGARDRGRRDRRVELGRQPEKLGHLGPVADTRALLRLAVSRGDDCGVGSRRDRHPEPERGDGDA
jgi:NAD(P)-dependent dehydrogenase (short-subunit alcohol dehydrogenase family)